MKRSGSSRLLSPPYRRPVLIAGGLILVYFIFMLFSGGLVARSGQIGLDLFICGGGMAFWLVFFAQFTLPLHRMGDRLKAFRRILHYTLGTGGPALRIENGVVKERKDESRRIGPGVVVLDTASAAVIRNPAEFVGACGPGVAFTEQYESIAGVVDLHLQRGQIGPQENEDPFAPQAATESEPAYQARRERRFSTQGLTRDGIEVVPRIGISVKLRTVPPEGKSRYGYNAEAVTLAVKGRPVDLSSPVDSIEREVDLTWLPLHLAADIWKECIGRYTLDELFAYEPGRTTAIQLISEEMRIRMTQSRYYEQNAFGQRTGIERTCNEYRLLHNRGTQVIAVSISFVKLPAPIEEQLIQTWKSSWLIRAQRESAYLDQQRSIESENGKRAALGVFARRVSHYLGAQSPTVELSGRQILQQLIRGTIHLTNHETYLQSMATDEIEQFKELLEWSEGQSEP